MKVAAVAAVAFTNAKPSSNGPGQSVLCDDPARARCIPRALTPPAAALLASACADSTRISVEATRAVSRFTAQPGAPGAVSDRMLYQVMFEPPGGSRSHGVVRIEIVGGYTAVTVHATGLMPNHHTPQHIHGV